MENLLICYDDLDLPLGTIRIKPKGGSAGHKGMRSVIASLGSSEFPRLRVGIDRPPGKKDPADYVLEDFSPLEKETVKETASQAVDCIRMYLFEGLEPAMNHCNQQRS